MCDRGTLQKKVKKQGQGGGHVFIQDFEEFGCVPIRARRFMSFKIGNGALQFFLSDWAP